MLFRLEVLSLSFVPIVVSMAFLKLSEELNPVEALNAALEAAAYSASILVLPSSKIAR